MIRERRYEPPYRTVLFLMYLAALNLAALALLMTVKGPTAESMLNTFIWGTVAIGGVQVGKRLGERAAGGKGFSGMVRVLAGAELPGDPAPPKVDQAPAPAAPPAAGFASVRLLVAILLATALLLTACATTACVAPQHQGRLLADPARSSAREVQRAELRQIMASTRAAFERLHTHELERLAP